MDLSTGPRKEGCVFCDIVAGEADTVIVEQGAHHVAFEPLNPFLPGHLLFVPRTHVEGPIESAALTGRITEMAIRYAQKNDIRQFNTISSSGQNATQTVFHLHVHLLPRESNVYLDGWPWHPSQEWFSNAQKMTPE